MTLDTRSSSKRDFSFIPSFATAVGQKLITKELQVSNRNRIKSELYLHNTYFIPKMYKERSLTNLCVPINPRHYLSFLEMHALLKVSEKNHTIVYIAKQGIHALIGIYHKPYGFADKRIMWSVFSSLFYRALQKFFLGTFFFFKQC